jgi:hypothetical protein
VIYAIEASPHERGASCLVDMSAKGRRSRSTQEWLVAGGAVFRIGSDDPAYVPREEAVAHVRAAAGSLAAT